MYNYQPLSKNKIKQISKDLYNDLFSNVFNKVHSELLSNVKLNLSIDKPIAGSSILKKTLILATPIKESNEHLLIYGVGLSMINGILYTNKISPYYKSKWINSVNAINNFDITIDIKTKEGIIIPHDCIYVKSSLTNNSVLYFCINLKCLTDLNINYKSDLYTSIYIDSTVDDDNLTKKTIISSSYKNDILDDLINDINNNYNNLTDKIFINGYIYSFKNYKNVITDLQQNNLPIYLDYISDKNIKKEFIVNDLSLLNTYYQGNKERYIIHLSKTNNNLDNITTIDTLDIYLIDNNTKKGLQIPVIDDTVINSITFSDISIRTDFINNLKNNLNNNSSNSYSIEIKYRIYDKDNVLDFNKNYTKLLYKYIPDDIINDLLAGGYTDNELDDIFNANVLEQSNHTKALYALPDKGNPYEVLSWSRNVYGYYRFCQKFCKCMYTIKSNEIIENGCTLDKSVFYKKEHIFPIVYYKGKVYHHYTYTETVDTFTIYFYNNISIDDTFFIQILPYDKAYNDVIGSLLGNLDNLVNNVENTFMYQYKNLDYSTIKPDAINNIFIIDLDNIESSGYNVDFYRFNLFLKIYEVSDKTDYNCNKLPYRYEKINLMDNEYFTYKESLFKDNVLTFTFKPQGYNKEFLLVPNNYYTIHITEDKLDSIENDLFNLVLMYNDEYVIEIPNLELYLNGYELYNTIDYTVSPIMNDDNSISGYQLIIQTDKRRDLINNNRLDIYISTISKLDILEETGYGIREILPYNDKILYNNNENILKISADNKIIDKYNKSILSNIITIEDYVYNKPYKISYIIPTLIKEMLYIDNIDNDNNIISNMIDNVITGPYNTTISKIDNKNINNFGEKEHNNLEKILNKFYPYSFINPDNNYVSLFTYLVNSDDVNNTLLVEEYDNLDINNRDINVFFNLDNYYQNFFINQNNSNLLFNTMINYNNDNITLINQENTLGIKVYDNNEILKYNLYSPYTIFIIKNILNGNINISILDTDNDILNKLYNYNYYKIYDNLFNISNLIYEEFYDIKPLYNEIDKLTDDNNLKIIIQRVLSLIEQQYITKHLS